METCDQGHRGTRQFQSECVARRQRTHTKKQHGFIEGRKSTGCTTMSGVDVARSRVHASAAQERANQRDLEKILLLHRRESVGHAKATVHFPCFG